MTIRSMRFDERDAVARLIHASTNAWYLKNRGHEIFGGDWASCRVFPEVYESLDPGCCLVAVGEDGDLLGSCFYHPRETHVSLGIMNAAPEAAGCGVARRLLEEILQRAGGLPVRLVSSAMNLDSFSLYTRAGFVPYEVFQDMHFPNGMGEAVMDDSVRDAGMEDVGGIVALEMEWFGISRRKDIEMFIRNEAGIWSCSVRCDAAGKVTGFLASVDHPGSRMLGPGAAVDETTMLALIVAEMRRERGGSPVFLVPSRCGGLVGGLYRLGARNCELHVAQALGEVRRPAGVMMPSFLPESA